MASCASDPEAVQGKSPLQFRLRTIFLLIAACAALLSTWTLLAQLLDHLEGPISRRTFKKITLGMSLDEVEAILGPGRQIPVGSVTRGRGSPSARETWNLDLVIDGDQFFEWRDDEHGKRIELGMRDGKVCDKFFWEPCL
jgi:hypothetical protein